MSSKYHCPRCEFDRDFYKAPLGKVHNPQLIPLFIDCKACNGKGFIPAVVIAGIQKTFPNVTDMALSTLKWDMDHYYFIRHGTYIGVEVADGHCHS